MRVFLIAFFLAILGGMLCVTVTASLDRSVFDAAADIWHDPWSKATLYDAYFGFFVIYLWIYFRESHVGSRLLWFVLMMTLGNIATAMYFLIALSKGSGRDWRLIFPNREEISP